MGIYKKKPLQFGFKGVRMIQEIPTYNTSINYPILPDSFSRACLKKAFCKMCVTICGRFRPDEGAVAGYGNRIRVKYTAKWGVQIAGMIFQTRSKPIDVLTDSKRMLPFPGRKGGALAAGTSIIVLYVFFKDSFTSQVFRFFS